MLHCKTYKHSTKKERKIAQERRKFRGDTKKRHSLQIFTASFLVWERVRTESENRKEIDKEKWWGAVMN